MKRLHSQTKKQYQDWEQIIYTNYKNKIEAKNAIKILQMQREKEKEKRNLIVNNQLYDIDKSDDEDSEFEYIDE